MAKVTGIGGIFFKSKNPDKLKAWYRDNLGLETDEYGWQFKWKEHGAEGREGFTQWSAFAEDTDYFDPSDKPYMINYIVDDLDGVLEKLRAAGAKVDDKLEEYEYGRFGWFIDPEGTRIELWEPPA